MWIMPTTLNCLTMSRTYSNHMKTKAPSESQKWSEVKVSFTSPVLCWQMAHDITRNTKSSEAIDTKRKPKWKALISHEVFVIHLFLTSVISAGKTRWILYKKPIHIVFITIGKSLNCGKKKKIVVMKLYFSFIYSQYLSAVRQLGYISQNILILFIISKAIKAIPKTKQLIP